MSRRVFDRDYKLAAVRLIVDDELDVKEVSGLLDIYYNTLYRWVSEYEKLNPYKPIIEGMLEKEEQQNIPRKQRFTAKRMHSYLVEECGIEELRNSYITVSRYLKARKIEKRRNYFAPGTMPLVWHAGEAQGDFGEALFKVDGEERMMHYFVMTFPNSNRRIALVMPGGNCECVCTALQEIFAFIGGVPSRIVFDNATGIGRRVRKILEMNEGFSRFRLHYRFDTTFANPRSGWEKGSVENAVGTIRRNLFVPVRMITGSITEYNRIVMMRESFEFEAGKIHYRKGKAQSLIWQEEDEKALHALPEKDFTVHRIDSMTTTKAGSLVLDSKHVYNLGPLHSRQAVLIEKTAFTVLLVILRCKSTHLHRRRLDNGYNLYPDEDGRAYLATVIDGFLRKVIAMRIDYSMSSFICWTPSNPEASRRMSQSIPTRVRSTVRRSVRRRAFRHSVVHLHRTFMR